MTPRTAYPVCDFSYKRCCRNLMTKTHSQFARLCKARGNASTGSLPTQPLPAGYAACQPPEQAAPTPAEYGQPRASWEGGEESSCAQRSKDNETGFSYPASKILSWWLWLRCLQWSWKYQKDGSEKSCLSSEAAQPNAKDAAALCGGATVSCCWQLPTAAPAAPVPSKPSRHGARTAADVCPRATALPSRQERLQSLWFVPGIPAGAAAQGRDSSRSREQSKNEKDRNDQCKI